MNIIDSNDEIEVDIFLKEQTKIIYSANNQRIFNTYNKR